MAISHVQKFYDRCYLKYFGCCHKNDVNDSDFDQTFFAPNAAVSPSCSDNRSYSSFLKGSNHLVLSQPIINARTQSLASRSTKAASEIEKSNALLGKNKKEIAESKKKNRSFVENALIVSSIAKSIFSLLGSTLIYHFKIAEDLYSALSTAFILLFSDFNNIADIVQNLFISVKSIVQLCCSILFFPFRSGIVVLTDILKTINHSRDIIINFKKGTCAGNFSELVLKCFQIAKSVFAILALVFVSVKIAVACIVLSFIVGLIKVIFDLKKRDYLDLVDNSLGCAVDAKSGGKEIPRLFANYMPPASIA